MVPIWGWVIDQVLSLQSLSIQKRNLHSCCKMQEDEASTSQAVIFTPIYLLSLIPIFSILVNYSISVNHRIWIQIRFYQLLIRRISLKRYSSAHFAPKIHNQHMYNCVFLSIFCNSFAGFAQSKSKSNKQHAIVVNGDNFNYYENSIYNIYLLFFNKQIETNFLLTLQ